MAIIEKPINLINVANTLGYYEYKPHPVTGLNSRYVDLGRLCTHPNINMWAKYKPVRFDSVGELTEAQIESTGSGLSPNTGGGSTYLKPLGGAMSQFRAGDFYRYNHNATPPVKVELVKVNDDTNPPFRINRYEENYIEFKLIPGEIDPATISNQTSRIKATTIGNYGGLSWVGEQLETMYTEVNRGIDDVFSAYYLNTIHSQYVICNEIPHMAYMFYKSSNLYASTIYKVEDDSYMNSFVFTPEPSEFVTITPITLTYDKVKQKVIAGVNVINTGEKITAVRLKAEYYIDNYTTGNDQHAVGYTYTLNVGVDNENHRLELNYANMDRFNSYWVFYTLEYYSTGGSVWRTIATASTLDQSVFISQL